ncbi:protein TESPA1-like [Numida meleagris]|uniref:protein TESPA1-like n=1 Tax=Numida meleagris TaxID=8996 RepID=UPI000B3E1572|nr:protein TESPA1-like [Numida meleagris]
MGIAWGLDGIWVEQESSFPWEVPGSKKPQRGSPKSHILVLCPFPQQAVAVPWGRWAKRGRNPPQLQGSPVPAGSPRARGSPGSPGVAMEGSSVLSPSSWEKRRAWARQSRCWRTTVVEEEAAAAMQDVPELQPPHLDDVFLEGSSASKIETWLQDCGSSLEALPEESCSLGPYGCGSSDASFEDDLTLGAEALLLPGNDKTIGRALWGRRLNLGHSMASSALSGLTNRTSSSISEVLEWRQVDAEEILYDLGFVQNEPGAVARVPARFFSAPSRARGIDFQLFLKAQVRRLEMEDPCLMLASE